MQQNISLSFTNPVSDLGDAVVYQSGLYRHVAAHPVIHASPVFPQGVSVILDTATLHTKPGTQRIEEIL